MNYKLEKENDSKKIIILISVICCSIILVIGITTAFFTASKSSNIENIVTANINDTLIYNDSTTYMRQGLIPATESVAKQAYQRTEEGKKCLDSGDYSACSIYEFSIQNTANVSQDLIIDMIPTVNTFTNLYFMLYEIDSEGNSSELISSLQIAKLTAEIIQSKNIPTYNLREKITIKPSETKTYQIVFFINNTGFDQTLEDAGKKFGASIKITSIATGKYIAKTFGEECWQTELLSDGTYKLTEFYGINNDSSDTNYGNINESCTGYVSKDESDGFYSINIPSNVGGKQISTLGYNLFFPVKFISGEEMPKIYNYNKIKEININEGITTIEDGYYEMTDDGKFGGTFMYIGMDLDVTSGNITPLTEVNIYIPDNSILTKIGNSAFYSANLTNINLLSNLRTIGSDAFSNTQLSSVVIPSSVETIGDSAFYNISNLTTVTFEVAEDGTSSLTTIGSGAFSNTKLSSVVIPSSLTTIGNSAFYSTQLSSVSIPSSVETIGSSSFSYNSNLTTVTFVGAEDGSSNLKTIDNFAFSNIKLSSVVIPSSVETIGDDAFSSNSNLETVTFKGAEDGTSKLKTIGSNAFYGDNISSLLVIPSSVETIGNSSFSYNSNLEKVTFVGAENNTSNLAMIGANAFIYCNLTYPEETDPLLLPLRLTSIGFYAFDSSSSGTDTEPQNRYLNYIKFNGTLSDNTSWYRDIGGGGVTTLIS